MAYVVARPRNRFEIRESELTEAGPRSRTLASFGVLDDEVLARAATRAQTGFDVEAIVRSAHRVGAPVSVGTARADDAARALLREVTSGGLPSPALRAMVRELVSTSPQMPDGVVEAAEWAGATDTERGDALVDLLLLTDSIPARSVQRMRFPGFTR